MIDQTKFPITWHITDDEIVEAIWHREDDGNAATRGPSLAAALWDRLDDQPTEVHRELEQRMLALAQAKRLTHHQGDYALIEPVESARYVLKLRGEDENITYPIAVDGELGPFEMAELLSNLTGFRREFIVGTKLAAIQPHETITLKSGATPIRLIITRRV